MKIGFIGQGFVGKNMANDFENRGYSVVRYALEPEYIENKEVIKECDIVFIAVPTPSTLQGFDYSIVDDSLTLVGKGKVAVLKSTLLPGTTKKLQEKHPDIVILFSPEFLCESTAEHDAAHPVFNIVGVLSDSPAHQRVAETLMTMLPSVDNAFIVPVEAAELFKYTHNIHGFMRVVLSNLFYDAAATLNLDWSHLEQIMNVDPMMSSFYNSPVHKSGRGAGGNCFIKDMAAFRGFYERLLSQDVQGIAVLTSLEKKNLELLAASHKSQDLVEGIYGKNNSV